MEGDYQIAEELAEELGVPVPESKPKRSAADRAIEYVLASDVELFHDQHHQAFMVFTNGDGRREVWPLNSKAVNEYTRWRFYTAEKKGLSGEALATARSTLDAQAQFLGEP
ncbi:MAG TPA: hypothetical protein VFA32_05075, partial [Dehalococcoidia bacterium]|nr:hypothetical protein [Dehalococcoidia bacterium]